MEYLKTGRALFSMKIHFWPIWAKRAQIGPKIIFLNFLSLLKILKSFLGNNLKWKLILLLIFHHQSHVWKNSGPRFMGQSAVNQSSEKHDKVDFLRLQIKTNVFNKLIVSLWVCIARHVKSTQNNFTIFLQ